MKLFNKNCMDLHQCEYPGCNFKGKSFRSVSVHWTHKHPGLRPSSRISKQCKRCFTLFSVDIASAKQRPFNYCSRSCWREDIRFTQEKICLFCKKNFIPDDAWVAKSQKFCSRECADKGHVGEIRTKKQLNCLFCDKVFSEIPARITRGRKYCSRHCASRAKDRGRCTLAKIWRDNEAYLGWRDSVFQRDKYTCQKCGLRGCRKVPINAHHIKYISSLIEEVSDLESIKSHPEFANTNNGITLCENCHEQIHKKDKRNWGRKGGFLWGKNQRRKNL